VGETKRAGPKDREEQFGSNNKRYQTMTMKDRITAEFRTIVEASTLGRRLKVKFADGSDIAVPLNRLIPDSSEGAVISVRAHPSFVAIIVGGRTLEVAWSTLRRINDTNFEERFASAAKKEQYTVGLRLAKLRRIKGLTAREVAKRAGISPQSLSRIEKGRHDLVLSTLERILAAMDSSMEDFVGVEAGSKEIPDQTQGGHLAPQTKRPSSTNRKSRLRQPENDRGVIRTADLTLADARDLADKIEEEGVPTWLETPATNVPGSLPTVSRVQILPLNDLTWENFERLCLRYVRGRANVVRTQLYGLKGQGQHGIDLYARLTDPPSYEVYQCKKLMELTVRDIERAVDRFLAGKWRSRSSAFRIMTSQQIEDAKIAEVVESEGKRLEAQNISFEVLGAAQISLWLKDQPGLVDDFFSHPWVEAFCGTDALQKLGKKLNAVDVAKYRQELKTFYEVLFDRHDPGIPVQTRIGDSKISLRERFVVPEIYASLGGNLHEHVSTGQEKNADFVQSPREDEPNQRLSAPVEIQNIRVRADADRWISQGRRSVILGGPGSGKSALLRILAVELLSEEPIFRETAARWGSLLPVWIPFSFWTNLNTKRESPIALSECLAIWFKQFDQSKVWSLVESALDDDRLLLLVDGLDEWTDETAARTTSHILQTYIQTRNLPALVVSRPHGFERVSIQGAEWQVGRLAPLSPDQQRALVMKWSSIHNRRHTDAQPAKLSHQVDDSDKDVERAADDFIYKLAKSNDLSQLAEIPLTLLLLLYLHLQNYPLPANRFEAYEYVTNHFIREHPLARRTAAARTDEQSPLSAEEIRKLLSYLAYVVQTEFPAGTLSADGIRAPLEEFLQDNVEHGLGLSRSEAREVLRLFTNVEEGALGLLVSQGQSAISFFHRSLQEYLAAVHLARTSLSDQQGTIRIRLADPRWREVIVAMICLCRRAEDTKALVEAADQADLDPIGTLAKEDLLAEIAFRDSNLPQSWSKSLAMHACAVVETSMIASHRSRLLGHAMSGLRFRTSRSLIQERIKRWVFSRGLWGPSRIEALRPWPATDHTWEVLFRALHDEDAAVIRAAASVIAHIFCSQSSRGDTIAQIALRSDSSMQRAACIECLSRGWPEHGLLATVIAHGRQSVSNEVRISSIAATVRLGKQQDADLTELLNLARDRFTSSTAYSWRPEVANTLAEGWPKSARLKEECIRSTHHHAVNPTLIDRDIALFVLVKAFPQDDDVARAISNLLSEGFSSFRHDSIWQILPLAFRDHPTLVAALDEWVVKDEFQDPIALHHGALVGRTKAMKQKLLAALDQWVPFWAVGALLKGWGMSDPEVALRLPERAARNDAAEIGQFIPEILNEPPKACERLLTLLRDPMSQRIDFLMKGFSQLHPVDREREIVDAAIDRLGGRTSWTMEDCLGSLILTFPGDDRVKKLAQECLESQNPPLAAFAEAYSSDYNSRIAVGELITPLPATLRYQIVSDLSIFSEKSFALDVLKQWDTERNAEVKTQASIQYHSLLSPEDVETTRAVALLDSMLPCYGPDHEERRQAAAAGLIVLKQLHLVLGKIESIGHVGHKVNIPVSDAHKKNRVFLNVLGRHWAYVKQILNNNFELLTPNIGPSDLWQNLAIVAADHSSLAKDILERAESDPGLRRSASFITLVGRLDPRSERLSRICLAALADNTSSYNWFDSTEAAAVVLAEQFRGDTKMEERLVSLGSPDHLRTGIVMALSLGWRGNQLLRDLEFDAARSRTMDAGELYVKYACIPAAMLATALEADLTSAQRNPFLVNNVIRPVIARLRDDLEAVRHVSDMLFATVNPSAKASFSRILASSSSFSVERDKWRREELERQRNAQSPEIGYDLLAKITRGVSLCLLESLGEAMPLDLSVAD
jgi:transcriptional regulator with XRE-family HTH domain